MFNIAYTYERLGRYPEAYRYFMDARENERDEEQLRRIDVALDVIVRQVAVLRVESEPVGATLFLERKDLGAHRALSA